MVASHFRLDSWSLPYEDEVCRVIEVKIPRLLVQKHLFFYRTEFNEKFSLYTLFQG